MLFKRSQHKEIQLAELTREPRRRLIANMTRDIVPLTSSLDLQTNEPSEKSKKLDLPSACPLHSSQHSIV